MSSKFVDSLEVSVAWTISPSNIPLPESWPVLATMLRPSQYVGDSPRRLSPVRHQHTHGT
jgi:hypothetical protein